MNRPTFVITLASVGADDVPAEVRLKRLLKLAGRSLSFKAIDVRIVANDSGRMDARHATGRVNDTPKVGKCRQTALTVRQMPSRLAGEQMCGTGKNLPEFTSLFRTRACRTRSPLNTNGRN
jgi:hypothetical protein